MSAQLCFAGMDEYRRIEWRPQPHKLAEIQNYLRGFAAHGMEIFAKRRYIANRLGIGISTLSRYLAYLKECGWIETIRRTARSAIRKLTGKPLQNQATGTPAETSHSRYPSYDLKSEEPLKEETRRMPQSSTELARPDQDAFKQYIGVFLGSGKALNERDLVLACREWLSLGALEQASAHQDALRAVREASAARFIPSPYNHLLSRSWTRQAIPGARPMTKNEQRDAEVDRILREKRERRSA